MRELNVNEVDMVVGGAGKVATIITIAQAAYEAAKALQEAIKKSGAKITSDNPNNPTNRL
jgi:hypothetical protein